MKRRARQQEFGFTNWGGKRRGAGRKRTGERARVSHAKRAKLAARFPVLVTLRLRDGLRSLRTDATNAFLRSALAAGSCGSFRVIEFSIQTNHLHAIVEAGDERSLSRAMNGLATRIARGLNRLWQRAGRVFDDRYHARVLTTPRAVRTALVYVLSNGRKHGVWRASASDVYSLAPSFEGWKGGIEKGARSKPRLLERARTWLLSIGWRRHGLLDPLELPLGAEVFA
jgi:REP element-mobilizing transposase RayT